MKAMDLLCRYDKCAINVSGSGILEDIYFNTIETYVSVMFGKGSEILFGDLECGKNYIYAYVNGDELPDGFQEDDVPAMCVLDCYGWSIWFYEIED
jgi:hypothetical protein